MTDILKHHRIGYLDAVRVLAMVMVVAMHAPLPKSNTNSMLADLMIEQAQTLPFMQKQN